jgi:hypothetical protein
VRLDAANDAQAAFRPVPQKKVEKKARGEAGLNPILF